jgi:hypothetical protein
MPEFQSFASNFAATEHLCKAPIIVVMPLPSASNNRRVNFGFRCDVNDNPVRSIARHAASHALLTMRAEMGRRSNSHIVT